MPRLLIVEDYPPLATVLAIALRRNTGYEVVRVGGVQRAEGVVSLGAFDVLISDVELPDGSGVELARELLASGGARACVFFTASRDERVVEQARLMGRVVDKLSPVELLVRAVLDALDGASAASGVPVGHRSGIMPVVDDTRASAVMSAEPDTLVMRSNEPAMPGVPVEGEPEPHLNTELAPRPVEVPSAKLAVNGDVEAPLSPHQSGTHRRLI